MILLPEPFLHQNPLRFQLNLADPVSFRLETSNYLDGCPEKFSIKNTLDIKFNLQFGLDKSGRFHNQILLFHQLGDNLGHGFDGAASTFLPQVLLPWHS